jgi:hypothetical protein
MNTKRLPRIAVVMTEWPSGFVTLTDRELAGDRTLGIEEFNGQASYTIPRDEFYGAVSARHHGDIDAETPDARATREAFRSAAAKYGYR